MRKIIQILNKRKFSQFPVVSFPALRLHGEQAIDWGLRMAEFTVYMRDKNDEPLALHEISADSPEAAGPAAIA
jgi:hypothetical protein